ncbi:MAG: DEAD/DEAH box helicase [Bacteroidetes bacterium]|nr:DEAD/DEAH box helicase [Bacteroidales bacterium]MBU1008814.1 DEAD/DEAH box helicase [Bacteroidota bacterium]
MHFEDFKLNQSVNEGIAAIGYTAPSPIQELAIPIILEGKDLIACAQTGTGKTAAYLLPVIHQIITAAERNDKVKALIIAPTRELAIQIDQQMEGFSYFTGISSIAIYGGGTGMDYEAEKKALTSGAEIIVATPGRLISHLNMGYVDFSGLKHFIMDEADRMLDMGFLPDIQKILSHLPKTRQSLMFSATMPAEIRRLASGILINHEEINLAVSKPAENVLQGAYFVYDHQKIPLIESLIAKRDLPLILIFSATKNHVKELEKALKQRAFNVKAIHSDLEQEQRKEVLNQFKNREIQILVATDIVSRGIDIDDISLVINFNVPGDAEDYVHRVGRTARAEKSGLAITFINENEYGKFTRIEQLIQSTVIKLKLPEGLGEGPKPEDFKRSPGKRKFIPRRNSKPRK